MMQAAEYLWMKAFTFRFLVFLSVLDYVDVVYRNSLMSGESDVQEMLSDATDERLECSERMESLLISDGAELAKP